MDCDALVFCHGMALPSFFTNLALQTHLKLVHHFAEIEAEYLKKYGYSTPHLENRLTIEIANEHSFKALPIRYTLPNSDTQVIAVSPHYKNEFELIK